MRSRTKTKISEKVLPMPRLLGHQCFHFRWYPAVSSLTVSCWVRCSLAVRQQPRRLYRNDVWCPDAEQRRPLNNAYISTSASGQMSKPRLPWCPCKLNQRLNPFAVHPLSKPAMLLFSEESPFNTDVEDWNLPLPRRFYFCLFYVNQHCIFVSDFPLFYGWVKPHSNSFLSNHAGLRPKYWSIVHHVLNFVSIYSLQRF